MQTHQIDREKISCQLCNAIVFKDRLHVHMQEVHGEKKDTCEKCGNSFTTKRQLNQHMAKVHEEKFKCGICGLCCPKSSNLKEHISRVHAKIKHFVCHTCGKDFFAAATPPKISKCFHFFLPRLREPTPN